MTFPGTMARDGARAGELALDIVTGWAMVIALLALLGWATQTLWLFDARALLVWAVATPAALFAAHRLVPLALPPLLAAEGMHKVAVIAGANALGLRLAQRLKENPWLGVRLAGYFDDRAAGRVREPILGTIN